MTDTDGTRLKRAAEIRDRRQTATDESSTAPTGPSPETEGEDGGAEPEQRLLTVKLGAEDYAFDVTTVAEVIEPTSLTRVPRTPPVVAGVIELRGRVTTVLDPAAVLDPVGTSGEDRPIVVFDQEETGRQGAVGWLVDDVGQVLTPTADQYRDPPGDAAWMHRALRHEDDYVVVITPAAIFEQAAAAIDAAFKPD